MFNPGYTMSTAKYYDTFYFQWLKKSCIAGKCEKEQGKEQYTERKYLCDKTTSTS